MGRVGLRQTPGPGDQPLTRGTCFLSCSKAPGNSEAAFNFAGKGSLRSFVCQVVTQSSPTGQGEGVERSLWGSGWREAEH